MAITTKTGLEPALTGTRDGRSGQEPGFGRGLLDLLEPLTDQLDSTSGLPLWVRHRGDGAEMRLVPAGPFVRGCDGGEPDEAPAREIYLDGYYIDIYPVSNARYRQFHEFVLATNDHSRCYPAEHLSSVTRELNHCPRLWAKGVRGFNEDRLRRFGDPQQPVVTVTWYDAFSYCAWSGKLLPTEAQWEKAARGSDGRRFPWGNAWEPERLNAGLDIGATTAVDAFPQGRSPFGVMDLLGNVWEWCGDRYDRRGYVNGSNRNPVGPTEGLDRVCRGGAWNYISQYATATCRHAFGPSEAYEFVGFRTVLPILA
ncbi:MAG: SUMF1/EgtB/PvdO family nonheme iron enzyme [Fimbriimonadaceae bacterium]|nr:SUMF1/EgtB/PvdO family nonheme iron enzyme [Fimbriimonadaceae bacterium]